MSPRTSLAPRRASPRCRTPQHSRPYVMASRHGRSGRLLPSSSATICSPKSGSDQPNRSTAGGDAPSDRSRNRLSAAFALTTPQGCCRLSCWSENRSGRCWPPAPCRCRCDRRMMRQIVRQKRTGSVPRSDLVERGQSFHCHRMVNGALHGLWEWQPQAPTRFASFKAPGPVLRLR